MILLIDADILAYKFASRNQQDFDFGDTGCFQEVDFEQAKSDCDRFIEHLLGKTNCDSYVSCLTDPDNNFRKQVLPDYKGNRTGSKPELLTQLKDYLFENHNGEIWKNLEADDVLGILSRIHKGSCKIATIDKDLYTVPNVPIYNWSTKEEIIKSPQEALRFFLKQVLTGDLVDGYKGCPGIGPVKAEKILDKANELFDHVYGPEGPLKRLKEITWSLIIDAYESKALTESDALVQARCAYILRRPSDYNKETGEVKLWSF